MPDKPKYYQDYNELVELMKNSDHNYNYERKCKNLTFIPSFCHSLHHPTNHIF